MPANKSTHSTPSKDNGNKLGGANGCRKTRAKQHRKQHRHHNLLHSEYRSTYTWHEFTGPSAQEQDTVVRRAPQPPSKSLWTCMEPPLPRRKKCPELAYRHHEFIPTAPAPVHDAVDNVDSNVIDNRIKEARGRGGSRATQLMSKAISRISTEYRLQFGWPGRRAQPRDQQLTNGGVDVQQQQHEQREDGKEPPKDTDLLQRKAAAGALRQSSIMAAVPAAVHKRRPPAAEHRRTGRDGGQASELEPLVQDTVDEPDDAVTIDRQQRSVRINEDSNRDHAKDKPRPFSAAEVMELRRELKRLADEYKHRDWGGVMAQEDEASLWKRVSTNHALNALALARSATKEEKDKENTRKVVPVGVAVQLQQHQQQQQQQLPAGRPSSVQARSFFQQDDSKADNENARMGRARRDFLIRHHLERTTGADDGALLVSPTREKLEPVMPRRREESSAEPTPRSKSSPKSSPRAARSQSVGPGLERRSPKRSQTRPASGLAKDAKDKDSSTERQQRPSKVGQATGPPPSSSSRWKRDASVVGKSRSRSVSVTRRAPPSKINRLAKPSLAMTMNAPPHRPAAYARHQNYAKLPMSRPRSLLHQPTASSAAKTATAAAASKQAMTAEPQVNGVQPQPAAQQQQQQQQGWIDDEPVVKSPPEPTRVKSPEQMIMRSPEPVNWTVPLDTGKTFTVTQNVREGEPPTRAHSEARSWGGPTSVKQQPAEHKLQQQSGYKSPESESVSLGSFSGTNGHKDDSMDPERTASPLAAIAKDEVEQQPAAFEAKKDELLDKARDRFDKFWGSKGPEQ
ncbi:uncharacterized protein LOC131667221 isoform X3 [Phymastichus coffea]|uniref:uncharacterized protein LOC131667221 isoform X3 n=1 Tax=Phymastichus coffea TaxID=108790 RepID=UPI00273BFB6F|nr:uncharacterized protein LOC131667221 isoform X3 [Phymastichus coffea]